MWEEGGCPGQFPHVLSAAATPACSKLLWRGGDANSDAAGAGFASGAGAGVAGCFFFFRSENRDDGEEGGA